MNTKPGWKTTEFWINAATIAGLVVSCFVGAMPPKYAGVAVAVSGGLYAVGRGLAKMNQ